MFRSARASEIISLRPDPAHVPGPTLSTTTMARLRSLALVQAVGASPNCSRRSSALLCKPACGVARIAGGLLLRLQLRLLPACSAAERGRAFLGFALCLHCELGLAHALCSKLGLARLFGGFAFGLALRTDAREARFVEFFARSWRRLSASGSIDCGAKLSSIAFFAAITLFWRSCG